MYKTYFEQWFFVSSQNISACIISKTVSLIHAISHNISSMIILVKVLTSLKIFYRDGSF